MKNQFQIKMYKTILNLKIIKITQLCNLKIKIAIIFNKKLLSLNKKFKQMLYRNKQKKILNKNNLN